MSLEERGFLLSIDLLRDAVPDLDVYPFSIPAVAHLGTLRFHPRVTFLVGENASGKSTLVEAIAIAAGLNPEGGTSNFNFSTRSSESELHRFITVVRGHRRPRTNFFLRAESLFNVATQIDALAVTGAYGGVSLHEQSHGESFLSLVTNKFTAEGLYILDEPEAALSLRGQLALLVRIHDLTREGSQFIIATHSPILIGYEDAWIYALDDAGFKRVLYEDTDQYQLTRAFLENRERFLHHLFDEQEEDDP